MSKSLNNENFSRKQETLFTFIEDEFQVFYQDIIDKQTLPNLNIQDEDIKIYLYIKMLKYTHQELYNDLRDSAKNNKSCKKIQIIHLRIKSRNCQKLIY